jgi:hypothetical protein
MEPPASGSQGGMAIDGIGRRCVPVSAFDMASAELKIVLTQPSLSIGGNTRVAPRYFRDQGAAPIE